MPSFINLQGKIFNELTVIKLGPKKRDSKRKLKPQEWWCECSCSSQCFLVRGSSLKSGTTKSCGCLKTYTTEEWVKKAKAKYGKNMTTVKLNIKVEELR